MAESAELGYTWKMGHVILWLCCERKLLMQFVFFLEEWLIFLLYLEVGRCISFWRQTPPPSRQERSGSMPLNPNMPFPLVYKVYRTIIII